MSGRPGFPADDLAERERYFHHLEWGTSNGYEYKTTRVKEADYPDGWKPEAPKGWTLNVDHWPLHDEEAAGWTRIKPGILRNPYGLDGPELIAHWRRKR